jgi:hypothetical protein
MYSDVFLLATAISGVFALAALRLGLPAALAPLAAALVIAIAAVVAVVWRYFKLLADVRRWG